MKKYLFLLFTVGISAFTFGQDNIVSYTKYINLYGEYPVVTPEDSTVFEWGATVSEPFFAQSILEQFEDEDGFTDPNTNVDFGVNLDYPVGLNSPFSKMITYYQDNGWEKDSRLSIILDGNGNKTKEFWESYSPYNNSWEDDDESSYFSYDSQNRLIESKDEYTIMRFTYVGMTNKISEMIEMEWDYYEDDYINTYKTNYSYNPDETVGEIVVEIWDEDTDTWGNNTRNIIEYNAQGKPIEIYGEYWDDDELEKNKMVLTYNTNGKILENQYFEFDGSNYVVVLKTKYYYNATNKVIKEETMFLNEDINSWNTFNQVEYSYNSNGLLSNRVNKSDWGGTGNFEVEDEYILEYNSHNQIVKAMHLYGGMEMDLRDVYSFYYGDGGSTGILEEKDLEFVLYPNPASDKIQVQMKDQSIQSIEIADITGKIVYKTSSQLNGSVVTISTDQLKNGSYFLKVQSGNEVGVKPFIVNH